MIVILELSPSLVQKRTCLIGWQLISYIYFSPHLNFNKIMLFFAAFMNLDCTLMYFLQVLSIIVILGAGESGKSTIFKQVKAPYFHVRHILQFFLFFSFFPHITNDAKNWWIKFSCTQIKLLFQTGFDEAELKSYISVIHANVYQTIKVCNSWRVC